MVRLDSIKNRANEKANFSLKYFFISSCCIIESNCNELMVISVWNTSLISKSPYMADMAGKPMSVDSEAVVHTESVGYTVQAAVLLQGDAPVPVEQYSPSLMRPTFHMRI